jgi:hypothetical protein
MWKERTMLKGKTGQGNNVYRPIENNEEGLVIKRN